MNIFKVIIGGLLTVGVLSQNLIQEDPQFFQDLNNIMGNSNDPMNISALIEIEDVDTAVV